MKSFLFTLGLKTKLDIRSSEIFITYYGVPLVFFFVMGAVFTSIMPEAKETLIATMKIFTVTMGAFIGTPSGIIEYIGKDLRKTFRSVGIPMHTILSTTVISGFINLSIVATIIYFTAPMFYNAVKPENLVSFLLGVALFTLATLLLGLLIGLYGKSSSKVTMLSQAVFLPSMMLSGIMFPSEMLPRPLEIAGLLLPATHGMKILSSDGIEGVNFAVLAGFILVALILIGVQLKSLETE